MLGRTSAWFCTNAHFEVQLNEEVKVSRDSDVKIGTERLRGTMESEGIKERHEKVESAIYTYMTTTYITAVQPLVGPD